jgi:hypothetical protein
VRELPWYSWNEQEKERLADKPARKFIRPSLSLPEDQMAMVDRIAAVQGLNRNEVVEMAIDFFFASWRPRG